MPRVSATFPLYAADVLCTTAFSVLYCRLVNVSWPSIWMLTTNLLTQEMTWRASQICKLFWLFAVTKRQKMTISCCGTVTTMYNSLRCQSFLVYYITVCTVVQNCCKGRSKKALWGCSLSETRQRIDIKFDRDDYVGDRTQYPKWYINRFRSVISTKWWNVNGLCFYFIFLLFLVRSFARGQTVGPIFYEWYVKMRASG